VIFALVVAGAGAGWIGLSPVFDREAPFPLLGVAYMVDDPESRNTLLTQGHRLSTVITTNFNLTDTAGTLWGRPDPQVIELAHRLKMNVHFRVANYSRGRFGRNIASAVLSDPAARAHAMANILRVLDSYHYDGVNIDLEDIPPGRRAALTAFVAALGVQVHQRGKTLSIAVPGKTVDELRHAWNGAFDLAALGQICDFVVVMAYDQYSGASGPGPVASLPWVEAVTQFATSRVDREKILLGLAFYGYVWPRRGGGFPISMRRATSRAVDAGVPILWDERNQVPYYRVGGRTVYFEDARSIQLKLALATREQLGGVSMWRLGLEDPGLWEMLGMYLGRNRIEPAAHGWIPRAASGAVAETATEYK
jgi:spore germination protein YaaH